MKALMDGTNLSSTGNPSVKTVKTITRYVIKPLTYSTALPDMNIHIAAALS